METQNYNPEPKATFKEKVLKAGIALQQKNIEEWRKRVQEVMASKSLQVDERDNHPWSFRPEPIAEVSLLSDQLYLATHELDELKHIQILPVENHSIAEYGTIVKTNKDMFFISVGVERFYANDQAVFGLSVLSPLYQVMKGKKVGDSFTYEGITHKIEEIF